MASPLESNIAPQNTGLDHELGVGTIVGVAVGASFLAFFLVVPVAFGFLLGFEKLRAAYRRRRDLREALNKTGSRIDYHGVEW